MRYEKLHLKDYFPILGENGKDPTLELFLPYNMTEMGRQHQKRPAILICPGGGYGMVSQREAEPIALKFTGEGYNVFILTYSVAPHRFPSQLREAAAAMELIHENAEGWNCDPTKIAIMGFSAGGHLAANYSTGWDWPEVREVFPESKAPNASILCYPVITADPELRHTGSFVNLLGREPDEAQIQRFSLDRQVSEKTPQAFLWHTYEDALVPVMNSLLYAQALVKHHIPVSLHIYPVGWHGLATADEQTNGPLPSQIQHAADWIEAALKWLKIIFA